MSLKDHNKPPQFLSRTDHCQLKTFYTWIPMKCQVCCQQSPGSYHRRSTTRPPLARLDLLPTWKRIWTRCMVSTIYGWTATNIPNNIAIHFEGVEWAVFFIWSSNRSIFSYQKNCPRKKVKNLSDCFDCHLRWPQLDTERVILNGIEQSSRLGSRGCTCGQI